MLYVCQELICEMDDKTSEDEYLGNIWGWKVSFLSLALILFMIALMGMRYCYLKQQGTYTDPTELQADGDSIF